MTAIAAASAGVRDMADGSLRITLEFEPRHAKEAYALFGSRGTPVAVAALKEGYAAVKDEPPKGGPLAREAAEYCRNEQFQIWLCCESEGETAQHMYDTLQINTRAELDHDSVAADKFIQRYRAPFMAHMRRLRQDRSTQ